MPEVDAALAAGQCVGVIGLGGLGHMAVKLAAVRKSELTVFTTSPGKIRPESHASREAHDDSHVPMRRP
jgi:D-arabinose 1-dehydrogenase-like Zn-dependent alcohol dehydrogenase